MRTAAGNKCLGASIDAGAAGKAICADGRARVGHQGCCPFRGSENRAWRWGAGGAQGNSPSGPPARKVSGARTATPSIPRLPGRHPLAMRPQLLGESSPVELSPSNPSRRRILPARPLTIDEGVRRRSIVSLRSAKLCSQCRRWFPSSRAHRPPGKYPRDRRRGISPSDEAVRPAEGCLWATVSSGRGAESAVTRCSVAGIYRRRCRIVGAQPPGSIPCEGLRLAERQSDASAPRGPFRQPNMSFRSGRSHCQDVTVVLCTSAAGPISISNAIVGGASRPSADISARGCLCERPPLSKAKGSEARSASPRQDLQRRRRRRRDSPPRRRRPLRGDPFKRPREASPAKGHSR